MRSSSWQTSRKMVTTHSRWWYTSFQEKSRLKIMVGLRRFIMVDNHVAVKVGDLEKNMKSRTVVKPKFTTDFPEAVVREGAAQLRLRAEQEGILHTFIDTTDVGDRRWGPPLVGGDWHAICQAIFQGVEGSEWETMNYNCTRSCRKRSNVVNLEENKVDQGTLVLERSRWRRNRFFLRFRPRATDPNKIPCTAGSLGTPPEEPNGCLGRCAETHGRWIRTVTVFRRSACSVSFLSSVFSST